jgi:hypothetical protein
VLENVIANENVTRALNDEGIDNIINLVKSTDEDVNNLTYLDPDSKIRIKLKLGQIDCIKSFIHYVHFREETNPIGNYWKSITILTNLVAILNMFVGFHLCPLCHHLI